MGGKLNKAGSLPTPVSTATLPAGFDPHDLDASLTKCITMVEANLQHALSLEKEVGKALKALETVVPGDAMAHAGAITMMYDRMVKAGLNAVKAIDELSRLRSFLAGGPDSRPDLTIKGEIELRAIIVGAIKTMGPEVAAEIVEELSQ